MALVTNKPLRIALVYDVIYPWSIGGGEKIIWELAVRLASRGHHVDVLSSRMWDGPHTLVRDNVRCVGVCPWLRRSNNLGNRSLLQPFLFAAAILWHLLMADYDVVVCNAFPYLSCFTARVATVIRRVPLAFTWYEARGYEAWKNYAGAVIGFFAALLERVTARLCRNNSTISPFTADRMTALLGIPRNGIEVIPCGVECAAFTRGHATLAPPALLYVGRLVRHKRVDLLVTAFADLRKDFPDLRLKIVGPGAEMERLQKSAAELGILENTEFLGSLVGTKLCEAYADSAVFVLPSELEGFGMVLIEAMAAGLPVIVRSSKHSAAATVVTDGVNALVFHDAPGLASAIRRVLTDESLRLKLIAGGHETASKYDWNSVVVPQFEAWLTAIVANARSPARTATEGNR